MKNPLHGIGKAIFWEIVERGWPLTTACKRLKFSRATAYRIKDDERWLPGGQTLSDILEGLDWDLYDLADRVADVRHDERRGRPADPVERLASLLADQVAALDTRLREVEDALSDQRTRVRQNRFNKA